MSGVVGCMKTSIQRHKGFSLIELMVVIAVVAVLAAIAVPAYKRYVVSARVADSMNTINSLIDKAIQVRNEDGTFGTAYKLGLSTTSFIFSQGPVSPQFYDVMPYVETSENPNFIISGDTCGREGVLFVKLSAEQLGLPPLGPNYLGDNFNVTCAYWHNSETIYRYCGYNYGAGGTSVAGDVIRGMDNLNTGTSYDQDLWNANVTNNTTYINATCQ